MKMFEFCTDSAQSFYVVAPTLKIAIQVFLEYQEVNEYTSLDEAGVAGIFELELPQHTVVGHMDWTEPEESPFKGKKVYERLDH